MTNATLTPFRRASNWADRHAWSIFFVVAGAIVLYAYTNPNTPLGRYRAEPIRKALVARHEAGLAAKQLRPAGAGFAEFSHRMRTTDVSAYPADFREAWMRLLDATQALRIMDDGTMNGPNPSPDMKRRMDNWLKANQELSAVGAGYVPDVKRR